MFGQIPLGFLMLYTLYVGSATVATIACLYLLLRRRNAFAPDVVTPVRLRRWTAAFFASIALSHVWYMPAAMLSSDDEVMLSMLVGGLLDCLIIIPLAIVVLLCMLQDRRRPLWLAWVIVVPLVAGGMVCIVTHSEALMPMLRIYLLLLGIGLLIYMVREVRQYGRWLRDNYADLEHKEVWQSFVVLASILLMFGIYASGIGGLIYEHIVQVCGIMLVCYLLWRVETLSDLNISHPLPFPAEEKDDDDEQKTKEKEFATTEETKDEGLSKTVRDDIGPLLEQYCVDTQLYLQHELTVTQLAQAIGSNRTYLGQYFSSQGITYNTYINSLRINHFVKLYHEAVAAQRSFTAQQLASESGYRSYSTFSLAFKQRMGQSVKAWMREPVPPQNVHENVQNN